MRGEVGAGKNDAVIFAAGTPERVENALRRIIERAEYCLIGVPEETRKANEDGTTSYLRPLPGAARMYPETDVPPVEITPELFEVEVPELIEERAKRYESMLPKDLAWEMADSPYYRLFEEFAKIIPPTVVARVLHILPAALRRDGYEVDRLGEGHYRLVLEMIANGEIAKEGAEEALKVLCTNPQATKDVLLKEIGKGEDLDEFIERLVNEKSDLIAERGEGAFKPLMGLVMKEFRGKVDGKVVAEKLKAAIKKFIEQ